MAMPPPPPDTTPAPSPPISVGGTGTSKGRKGKGRNGGPLTFSIGRRGKPNPWHDKKSSKWTTRRRRRDVAAPAPAGPPVGGGHPLDPVAALKEGQAWDYLFQCAQNATDAQANIIYHTLCKRGMKDYSWGQIMATLEQWFATNVGHSGPVYSVYTPALTKMPLPTGPPTGTPVTIAEIKAELDDRLDNIGNEARKGGVLGLKIDLGVLKTVVTKYMEDAGGISGMYYHHDAVLDMAYDSAGRERILEAAAAGAA